MGVQIDLGDHFLENWPSGLRIAIIPSNCLPHLWENVLLVERLVFPCFASTLEIAEQWMIAKKQK